MKKRAILYTRMSTPDQIDSPSHLNQLAELELYCIEKDIEIIKTYNECASGRNFKNRTEWKSILDFVSTNKNEVDYVLVNSWERFSRNEIETKSMIMELKKFGVEAKEIEKD